MSETCPHGIPKFEIGTEKIMVMGKMEPVEIRKFKIPMYCSICEDLEENPRMFIGQEIDVDLYV